MHLSADDFVSFNLPKPSLHKNLWQSAWLLILNLVVVIAIAFAGFALMSATATAIAQEVEGQVAETTPAAIQASYVRPNDMNSGNLLLPSTRQGHYIEAPRLATDIDMVVNGPIARVKITQRFENPSKGWVEGIYVFPLPEDSAVDTLKMRVGDRFIEGKIKRREEARKIYEQARQEGKKTALLEQQRDNLFTNNIANIGPGETVIVYIEYQQTIRQDSGLFSLRFPMVVAPRYNPEPLIQTVDFDNNGSGGFEVIDPVPDRSKIEAPVLDPRQNAKINPVTMTIRLAAGFPIGEVNSPYHKMLERKEAEDIRILTLKNDSVPADRDFELSWRAKGEAPSAALFTEEVGGKHYLLAFLTPPEIPVANLPKKDREVIFIIDNSGSMAGESMDQAKLALDEALTRLSPRDRFNIIRFDDTHELLFNDAVRADGENIAIARAFVGRLQAEGGTEMLPALGAALVDRNRDDINRIRQVVFITDGAIGNEQQLFSAIVDGRGRSRVFTIGIGSAPNAYFMTKAAEVGRGTFMHVGAISEVKEKMGAFFTKLENPVMTRLSVSSDNAVLSETSPNPLPDLYKGEPIVMATLVDRPEGSLAFSGDFAGQPWQVNMDIARAAKGEGIGKLWARRKIASLEASRSYATHWQSIDQLVEEVALAHHLVSSRTSLVAVDMKVTRPQGEGVASTKLPLNLPAGWDAEKWFDAGKIKRRIDQRTSLDGQNSLGVTRTFGGEMRSKVAMRTATYSQAQSLKERVKQTRLLVAAAPTPRAASEIALANRALTLPQTATQAERNMIIGLLLMMLSLAGLALMRTFRRFRRKIEKAEREKRAEEWRFLP